MVVWVTHTHTLGGNQDVGSKGIKQKEWEWEMKKDKNTQESLSIIGRVCQAPFLMRGCASSHLVPTETLSSEHRFHPSHAPVQWHRCLSLSLTHTHTSHYTHICGLLLLSQCVYVCVRGISTPVQVHHQRMRMHGSWGVWVCVWGLEKVLRSALITQVRLDHLSYNVYIEIMCSAVCVSKGTLKDCM